jgi:anthranilate synthase component 2
MVFVLDSYDSFTFNLVQYMGELGAEMVVRRNDELTSAEVEALQPERIVISRRGLVRRRMRGSAWS